MFDINNEKRNQTLSSRGRAVGSDVVIFHAETEKALSFLRLRGASGAQGNSAPASCREAHKRRFILNQWILHFANAPFRMTIPTLAFLLSLNLSTAFAEDCTCNLSADKKTLTIKGCSAISSSSCADKKMTANNVIIGTGVTSIGYDAFSWTKSLTSITIPDSVTWIGTDAFRNASSLTSITIPDSVTYIGDSAFSGASSLTSITIPDSVEGIGYSAFRNASSLTSITLPGSLTEIGSYLFVGITGLTEINCAGTESECDVLESLLDEKGYLSGRTFNQVDPVTKCSSYTSSGCNACYAGYAFGNSSCHACGTGKNCHWDEDVGVVFDGCKDKYLRKENECIASSQGCGANFRLNDGECDRLRYTPAEAAKVLRDDNNNSVTITFKK